MNGFRYIPKNIPTRLILRNIPRSRMKLEKEGSGEFPRIDRSRSSLFASLRPGGPPPRRPDPDAIASPVCPGAIKQKAVTGTDRALSNEIQDFW